MSAYCPDDVPSELARRSPLVKIPGRGNRSAARPVVQGVGKSRAFVAALVTAGVVLSGCASGGGEETPTTTTSSAAAAGPVNPWDLPIEQRPALFDPCAELPVEAVEQGLGGPVEPVELYTRHQPGELMVCGWENDQIDISVLSTWKSRDEYLADRTFSVENVEVNGRPSMRALDNTDSTDRSCVQMFFTERGTVWVSVSLFALFREFNGERFADSCEALEQVISPIMEHFPEGDYT